MTETENGDADARVLICFGAGYSAARICRQAQHAGWRVFATSRSQDGAAALSAQGFEGLVFDGNRASPDLARAITMATHILSSVPANADDGSPDPVLASCAETITQAHTLEAGRLRWLGYLSTTGVYGDHDGAWVDETTSARPTSARSRARLASEQGWQTLAGDLGCQLQIFRLAGIYGPGRSPLDRVRSGTAQRIVKPGQVFSRIHVDDIAQAVMRGLSGFGRHTIYNVCDDLPAPPQDVMAFAAELLGLPVPPEVAFETADLSPMARSFYADNKRVSNARMTGDLGVRLAYPTYREGLRALAAHA